MGELPRAAPPSVGYGITRSVPRRAGYVHRTAGGGGAVAARVRRTPHASQSVRARSPDTVTLSKRQKIDISAELASIELSRDVFEAGRGTLLLRFVDRKCCRPHTRLRLLRPSACLAVALAWWGVLPR